MCADARGREIDICYMLWMWGCEYEYACGMYASAHVRLGWERGGDAAGLVTVNNLEGAMWKFEIADLYSQDCQHAHTKPLVKSSSTTTKKQQESKSILWFKFTYAGCCAYERGELLFNATVPSDTTLGFFFPPTNKWQDLNMNWEL